MKRYVGSRLESGCVVSVIDEQGLARDLDLHLHVRNHSPTGFEWGYGGSGPAQLALALCIDALDDVARATRVYHAFKWLVIANFARQDRWSLTQDEVLERISAIEQALTVRAAQPAGATSF